MIPLLNQRSDAINIDVGSIPAGWYDVYTYFTSGNERTDGNDVISLTYTLLPNGITSP